MLRMRFLFCVLLFSVLDPLAQAADCNLGPFFANPTRAEARKLAAAENCLSDLAAAFAVQKKPNVRLLLLKIALAHPQSEKRSAFFEAVTKDDATTDLEKWLAAQGALLDSPTNSTLQDRFLKEANGKHVAWTEFDFSFHGSRGLRLLEALFDRFDELSEQDARLLALTVSKDFRAEAGELIQLQVAKAFAKLFSAPVTKDSEGVGKLVNLIERIDDDVWRTEFLLSVASDKRFIEVSLEGRALRDILESGIHSYRAALPETLVTAIGKAYLNETTKPLKAGETEVFAGRREVLLSFYMLCARYQHHSRFPSSFDDLVAKNALFIAEHDLSEFRAGMRVYVGRMERPLSVVTPMLSSKNPGVKIVGLDFARAIPLAFWEQDDRPVQEAKRFIHQLIQPVQPPVDEAVLLEALATNRYLSRGGTDDAWALLNGLGSSSEDVRRRALWLVQEQKLESEDVVQAVSKTIFSDPSIAVRLDALCLASDRLLTEQDKDGGPWSTNRNLGVALFVTLRTNDENLQRVAKQALETYIAISPNAERVINDGLKSKDTAIVPIATVHFENRLQVRIAAVAQMLKQYRLQIDLKERSAPGRITSVLPEAAREIQEVILAQYRADAGMEPAHRSTRIGEFVKIWLELVKDLRAYEKDTDPKAQKNAQEVLDKLRAVLQ